ncbi:MAG: transporter [Microbacteriaceae bacterium]|jgi:iron(III) transport system substrate-binding protein|nr:transporter [Microbacteriaceae bacterium]
MRKISTALTATLVVGLAAAALTACSSASTSPTPSATSTASWSKVQSAADKEKTVTLYGNKAATVGNELGLAFEAEYPDIDFNYVQGISATQEIQVDQESAAGAKGADVFLLTDPIYADKQVSTGKFVSPVGPQAQNAQWAKQVGKSGYVNISIDPYLLCYNTNLVKTSPTTVTAMLNDKSLGNQEIGISDVIALGTIAGYKAYQAKLGSSFLTKLAATKPRVYAGFSVIAQALPAGEIKASLAITPSYYEAMSAAKAPVKCTVPTDAPIGVGYQVAALKNAKSPNAAQVLVNFMMTDKGQSILNGTFGHSPIDTTSKLAAFSYKGLDDPATVTAFTQNFDKLFKG